MKMKMEGASDLSIISMEVEINDNSAELYVDIQRQINTDKK